MANVRVARFITEVAPPKLVSVMRRRGSKMLDTIHEEDHTTNTLSQFHSHSAAASTNTSSSYNAIRAQQLLIKNVQMSISDFHA